MKLYYLRNKTTGMPAALHHRKESGYDPEYWAGGIKVLFSAEAMGDRVGHLLVVSPYRDELEAIVKNGIVGYPHEFILPRNEDFDVGEFEVPFDFPIWD